MLRARSVWTIARIARSSSALHPLKERLRMVHAEETARTAKAMKAAATTGRGMRDSREAINHAAGAAAGSKYRNMNDSGLMSMAATTTIKMEPAQAASSG